MKLFLKKFIIFSLLFLGILELFSRVVIDPFYFYTVNTYNEKSAKDLKSILNADTKHVDYLFIGSSRIPATINPDLIKKLSDGKTVINAGRGYMTAGIHYQALKYKLNQHPDYLKNALVFIEYPGPNIYTNPFKDDKFRVHEEKNNPANSMPHLMLPYMDTKSLKDFFFESPNSLAVKSEMALLTSGLYRSSEFINEYFNRLSMTKIFAESASGLADEGGIRNDNMDAAIEEAKENAKVEKKEIEEQPALTKALLDKSSLAAIYKLVTEHGGKLIMFDMPLHSVQKDIYSTPKAKASKAILEEWMKEKGIDVIHVPEFQYSDKDFPDTWHLGIDRRDEFSTLLFEEIEKEEV